MGLTLLTRNCNVFLGMWKEFYSFKVHIIHAQIYRLYIVCLNDTASY